MKLSFLIAYYGRQVDVARALGFSRSTVCGWPDDAKGEGDLPDNVVGRVARRDWKCMVAWRKDSKIESETAR